ncbi:hypothetical protein EMCG_05072 [[Emmonsia] crescens]|uniref:Uncharacterized protein n=1 Tax=[Emmonsia] crescens TaxID=73230 RepID=A0A0G2HR32_9EURO|nr:hypothetical protein EMCG_05072 [Emmonsia crescens UAMH 3008]
MATAAEMDDFRIEEEKKRCFLGYAKVPLSNLVFEDEGHQIGTRYVTRKDIDLLLGRFKVDRCRRDEPCHWIDAVVTPDQLQLFLDHSRLSNLSDAEPATLNLLPAWKIKCLQGRVRVAAAMECLYDEGDQWWVVRFYDETLISSEAQRYMREYRDVSRELISGEIYHNVRIYQLSGDHARAQEWIARWRPHTQRDFQQLQPREGREDFYRPLRVALDGLLEFQGLWSTYVNLHRLLPMRVPEEQANYLDNHIRREWNRITGGRPQIVDAQTVSELEGRSPMSSQRDREYVEAVFADGIAFSSITDPMDRDALCERVMQTPRIIPSLRTFHEDCKYFEPMAKLVRSLLGPKSRGSIQVGMKRRYRPPGDNNFYIQTLEGHRRERHANNYGFWSAYRQVFLAAMRNFFPLFPRFTPLKMHEVPSHILDRFMDDSTEQWRHFTELATSVGFSLQASGSGQRRMAVYGPRPRLLDPASQNRPAPSGDAGGRPGYPSLTTDAEEEWSFAIRCGMPDGMSFFMDRMYLYFDNIYSIPSNPPQRDLTSFAVKRDFFLAFFPPFIEREDPEIPEEDIGDTASQPQLDDDEAMVDAPQARATTSNQRLQLGRRRSRPVTARERRSRPRTVTARGRRSGPRTVTARGRRSRPRTVTTRESSAGAGLASAARLEPTPVPPGSAQDDTGADGLILQQTANWCAVKINTTVGKFAGLVARSPGQYDCIISLHDQLAFFIRSSRANSFTDVMPAHQPTWFASINMPAGILSSVPIPAVEALLREGKPLIMSTVSRDTFDQQMLHPGFDENTTGIELPYFDDSAWDIGEL